MRIAIYTRISRADLASANQRDQLVAFARSQKWKVVREFADTASGARSNRKAFQSLMAAASQHRFDLVLFWSLDRFSREGVAQTLKYLQLLESWGVGFRSFTEPYLDSLGVFKDAILALLATLAKQERVRISERTRAGLARTRARGTRLGRPSTLAEWLPAVQRLAKRGGGPRAIARKLKLPVSSVAKLLKSLKTHRATAGKKRKRPILAVSRPRPRKLRARI